MGISTSSHEAKRILGLLLIAMGLLFIFVLIEIAQYGLVAGFILAWVVTILISAGSFVLLNVRVRTSLPTLLAISIALIGWSLIFLVQLPGNLQILLAPVVGFVFILLYRFFKAKKSWSHRF